MEENYIHIFSYFLGDLLEKQKVSIKEAYIILGEFKKAALGIKSREQLIVFLDSYTGSFPQFNDLKKQLLNKDHIFNINQE